MNIARLFSYTQAVEVERDYWKAKCEEWQNYALMRAGAPPVSVVTQPRQTGPVIPPRRSLRAIKKAFMSKAADDFIAAQNGGEQ